jgi:DNA-binding NtrC family response regulator
MTRREGDDRLNERLEAGLAEIESTARRLLETGTTPRERILEAARRLEGLAGARVAAGSGAVADPPPGLGARLVGASRPMQVVLATLARIAPRESNVLIEGESGTGKELVARALHEMSPRRDGGFVAVDCGSLSDSLLESELFGHRKGAFTGATSDRIGLLEAASGGTLFLDEIANASPAFQTRLLRALQEREIRRLGENRTRRLDLRLVTATSGRLPRLLADGRFREDLYYRLNVVAVRLPSLRRRIEDLPDLVEHFLARGCRRHGLPMKRINGATLEVLLRYRWPGNVRELENVVERALLLAPGDPITPESLPPQILDSLLDSPVAGEESTRPATGEQRMIERALLEACGDKSRAARIIGWHRTKLYRRLRRYAIPNDFGRGVERPTGPETLAE